MLKITEEKNDKIVYLERNIWFSIFLSFPKIWLFILLLYGLSYSVFLLLLLFKLSLLSVIVFLIFVAALLLIYSRFKNSYNVLKSSSKRQNNIIHFKFLHELLSQTPYYAKKENRKILHFRMEPRKQEWKNRHVTLQKEEDVPFSVIKMSSR